MQKSPFKFLDSYSKEDREIFFGRDKEIEQLHSRVFESKILVVYGISGTGKSSLINCGLANKFNDSDWFPIGIRRGLNINQSLLEGLQRSSFDQEPAIKSSRANNKKNDIVKIIRSVYLDQFKPVYLIFDQFEELFIFGAKEEKDEFISTIKRVIDSDLQCRFIFSIREEYLAGITEFEKVIPSFLANRIRIEKMTRQNAIDVIEGPCRINNIEVEPGFSETLLEKLNPDSPEVELTYLQVYLDKIFHLASPDGKEVQKITIELLTKAGDVKDLLGTFLEEQIAKLDDPDSGLIILKSFVSVKGTKNQITEDEVIEYSKTFGKDIDGDTVKSLIQRFIGLRILRDKDQNGRYELRHDSLATKIYEKITLVEKELLEIRQFIENAFNNFEKRRAYLTAEDLAYIAPYEDKLFLNDRILKFISQSKWELHKARRRRQNVLIAVTVIIFSVLSFFTIWAMRERGNALEQKRFADEQKNSAIIAKTLADSSSALAMRSKNLAMEKEAQAILAQRQSDLATKEALAQRTYALEQKNIAEKLSVSANEQAKIANAEKLIAEQEKAKAVKAESKSRQLSLLATAQNLALKSSSFEKTPELMGLLAVQAYNFNTKNGGKQNNPVIWEALNNAWNKLDSSRHSLFSGSANEIQSMAFKNNKLITTDLDGQIISWTNEGLGTRIGTLTFNSPISLIRLNADGEKLVTQHDNLDMQLWDIREIQKNGVENQKLKGHSGIVNSVAFSKDESFLATGGADSLIIIWDIKSQKATKIKTIRTRSQVKAIVFCYSDSIISAQEDGSIILWQLNEDKSAILIKPGFKKFLSLEYNYIQKLLYAGCSDGSFVERALEVDTQMMNELAAHGSLNLAKSGIDTFQVTTGILSSNNVGIDMIKFDPNLRLIATSSWDKTIRIYFYDSHFRRNVDSGKANVFQLKNLNSRIRSLLFTPDGRLIASFSDKTVHLWDISSEKVASLICKLVGREMTILEWGVYVGIDIPYEKTCSRNP